jgi:hypothetical protein
MKLFCLVLCLSAGLPGGASAEGGKPMACAIDALNDRERGRRETLIEELMPKAQVTALPEGYQLTWSGDATTYGKLVEFIGYERRCCPFLEFELRVSGPDAPATLILRADEETKEFIQATGLFEGKP